MKGKSGAGPRKMRDYLKNNPEKAKEIENKIRAVYKPAEEKEEEEPEEAPEE